MEIKKIFGSIAAAGLALGGLVLAGKNEFGKKLGVKPSKPDLEDEFDDDDVFCEEETEETTDNSEEETEG